jgi:hypothetical protein
MRLALALLSVSVAACSTLTPDPPAPYTPSPLGDGLRLAEVQDPLTPDGGPNGNYHPGETATMTSLVVSWLDDYDETMDGKSIGTLYVQDIGSSSPYAGIDVYEETLVPASLTLLPGEVLDFVGEYQESTSVGSATFSAGTYLPQLSKPVGTFRYNFTPPTPTPINLSDLQENGATTDSAFPASRPWIGMLVTLSNVTVIKGSSAPAGNGARVTYEMQNADGGVPGQAPSIDNELYDLTDTAFPAGTHFSSVTGIVTWFYSFHVSPRTANDLQM